jgi:hypothetical protein
MIGLARALSLSAIASAAVLGQAAYGQDPDQSLKLYAVHIIEGPNEITSGNGVYLGTGLVVTAAHVASGSLLTLKIGVGDEKLSAEVVKRGQFSGIDLALLSIDDDKLPVGLRLRRMTICQKPPWPSENVIVATPEAVAPSHVIAPFLLPHDLDPKYRTAISDVATTGNSGSGVFDADAKCLVGIISAKIREVRRKPGTTEESHDVAKYFVPASVITEFIPPQIRH